MEIAVGELTDDLADRVRGPKRRVEVLGEARCQPPHGLASFAGRWPAGPQPSRHQLPQAARNAARKSTAPRDLRRRDRGRGQACARGGEERGERGRARPPKPFESWCCRRYNLTDEQVEHQINWVKGGSMSPQVEASGITFAGLDSQGLRLHKRQGEPYDNDHDGATSRHASYCRSVVGGEADGYGTSHDGGGRMEGKWMRTA